MKVNQIISEMTSGCVSSIAMPIGNIKKRTTETTNVPGLKPADKVSSKNKKKGQYANSVLESKTSDRPVQEAKLDEDDLILVPGQGMSRRTGFVKHDLDRAEHEGQTLKNSLHTIIRVATHLNKELSERDNFPEWVSEKIGNIKGMMVTVMDYLISDKEMHGQIQAHEMTGGVIAGGGVGESIIEAGSYNPLDQERQEQNAMDWSKRQFKNKELQGELGHEDNPNFDRNRNRGPFYIKINGKILRTRGEIKVFDYLNGARNYGSAILKKRPELKGKVFITNSPKDDEQGVEEGRFTVNRNTGAKLDPRTGVELPPKEKPLTMKQMFAQPKQPKLTLDDVWRKVEDVVGQIFPDGDPIDYLAPWLEKHGIRDFKIGEILDRAAKKNGYKDLYDYYDSMKDQYDRDNVAEGSYEETEETAVINMFEKLVKQGRDPIDMIAHKFGWGSYELDQLARNLGFKNSAGWALAVKQGKGVNEGVAEGGILKSIKRGLQGWDKNAVGPGGEKLGDPRDIVKRAKAMDTDTAKKVRSGLDAASDHSPAGLQKRVLDRKLKDVSESSEDPSYKKGWKLCDKDPSADPQHLFRKHGEGLDRNQFIKGFNDNAKLRGMSIYGDVSGDVDHSTLHYKEFKRDQGVAEGSEKKDMTGQTCEKCKKDKYKERSWNDDRNGTLQCSCGHVVDRWRKYKKKDEKQGVAEGSGPQVGDEVYYGNRLVGWFKGYSKYGKIITEPNVDEMGDEYLSKDAYWDPQPKITIKPKQGVAEGAKVDRMVKHIAKSERELGKSKDEAENIAWATANKRGMLDNKNKKSGK